MLRTRRAMVLAAAACVAGFVILLLVIYKTGRGAHADALALKEFGDLQRPWLARVSDRIVHAADPVPFAAVSALLCLYALVRRRYADAALAALVLAGANITTQVLKPMLATPRGTIGSYSITAEAFPSGHATAALSLALAAVIVAPGRIRPLAGMVGAAFALAVSFSIVSLDWHFPSDVAGGFLVVGAWCFASCAVFGAILDRLPGHTVATASGHAGEQPHWLAAWLLLAGVFLAAGIGASRLPSLTAYATGHTTFAVVTAASALLAIVIVGAGGLAATAAVHGARASASEGRLPRAGTP